MKVFNILKARELSEKGFDEYVEKRLEIINMKIEAAAKQGKFYLAMDELIPEPIVDALKKEGYSVRIKEYGKWSGYCHIISWELKPPVEPVKEKKRWGR